MSSGGWTRNSKRMGTKFVKLHRWKNRLEAKGLRVNVGKMKIMRFGVGLQKVVDSKKVLLWVVR